MSEDSPSLNDLPKVDLAAQLRDIQEKQRPISPELGEADKRLSVLPSELQGSVRGFIVKLAETVLAQQTRMSGDQPVVRATPDQVRFYEDRFREVIESGFINPHDPNPKRIS